MKRLMWTVGVSFVGLFIGVKAGAMKGAILGAIWAAGVGVGFGTIFSERRPTKLFIAYWAATLALVGPFWESSSKRSRAHMFLTHN
jgi:hypothetical protein